jgi:hypothetical protein
MFRGRGLRKVCRGGEGSAILPRSTRLLPCESWRGHRNVSPLLSDLEPSLLSWPLRCNPHGFGTLTQNEGALVVASIHQRYSRSVLGSWPLSRGGT